MSHLQPLPHPPAVHVRKPSHPSCYEICHFEYEKCYPATTESDSLIKVDQCTQMCNKNETNEHSQWPCLLRSFSKSMLPDADTCDKLFHQTYNASTHECKALHLPSPPQSQP